MILSDGLFNGLIYFTAGGTEVYFSSGFEKPIYVSMFFYSYMKEGRRFEAARFRSAAIRLLTLGRRERHPHGQGVATYLARYVRGGAIRNRRLLRFDGSVTFRRSRRGEKLEEVTLRGDELDGEILDGEHPENQLRRAPPGGAAPVTAEIAHLSHPGPRPAPHLAPAVSARSRHGRRGAE